MNRFNDGSVCVIEMFDCWITFYFKSLLSNCRDEKNIYLKRLKNNKKKKYISSKCCASD